MESLGPLLPSAAQAPAVRSPQRAAVLDLLRRSAEPMTVGELSRRAGLHENTVREHVEGLLAVGQIRRERAPSVGRGRPAWRYLAEPALHSTVVRDYLGLASALAGHLARTSADPVSDAVTAGREWGGTLAAGLPPAADAGDARRRVVRLLEDLGFAPTADAEARTVRLTRCPLLEAAREHPGVVCNVHLGVVGAALNALGDAEDAGRSALRPFAEPGACLLQLGDAPSAP